MLHRPSKPKHQYRPKLSLLSKFVLCSISLLLLFTFLPVRQFQKIRFVGFSKDILRAGTSDIMPKKGQMVTVHCTGYGKNKDLTQKFWSTKDPGQKVFQFQIGVGKVIKGWDEGVMRMQIGEIARLTCSPEYAYGTRGFPSWGIEPDSTLLFEIELLQIT